MIAKQLSFLIVAAVFFFAAQFIENHFFPVVEKFTVTEVTRYGSNVVVSGTINKARPCVLLQDVQAFTKNGEALEVEFLDRSAGYISRPVIRVASQPFGPWVIKGGANEVFSLYSLHRCHALWTQETKLVTIEDSK